MTSDEIPFNKKLRLVTREVHSISDALVNAKLAFALSNNNVWAEGLLVFYEIFRFLEVAMENHKGDVLGQMYVDGLYRTEAFEKDLSYYLGEDWKKTYKIRPAVANYLAHLEKLEKENSDILVAYVYHLYMGLLSGGQILKKKRMLANKLTFSTPKQGEGYNVTDFGTLNIYNLKCAVIKNVNDIASTLDQNTKDKILEESKKVFLLNNEIIQTIEGAKEVLLRKCFILLVIICLLFFIYYTITMLL